MAGSVTWEDIEYCLDQIRRDYTYLTGIGLEGKYLKDLLQLRGWDKGPRGYLHNTRGGVVYRLIVDGSDLRFEVRRSHEHVSSYCDLLDPAFDLDRSETLEVFKNLHEGFNELVQLFEFLKLKAMNYNDFMDEFGKLPTNFKRLARSQLNDEALLADTATAQLQAMTGIHQALRYFFLERTGTWS